MHMVGFSIIIIKFKSLFLTKLHYEDKYLLFFIKLNNFNYLKVNPMWNAILQKYLFMEIKILQITLKLNE